MKHKALISLIMVAWFGLPALAAGGGEHGGGGHVPLIPQTVNVILFFGLLWLLIKDPVKEFFANRRKHIRESLELAEKSREDAKMRLDEIEQKMARLDEELREIETRAKAEAEQEKARIETAAKEEAERIVEQAKAEVEQLRREGLAQVRAFITDLAVAEAEKTIRDTVTEEERRKLFKDFAARLGA